MRRSRRPQLPKPRSFVGGRDLRRLITMIGMLVILWMMISRASDPRTWKFFARVPEDNAANREARENQVPEGEVREGEAPAEPGPESGLAAHGPAGASPSQKASPAKGPLKPAASYAWETVHPEPGVEGPLDQDPEEREGAADQFQAITDMEPLAAVDMPAYWRLMRWARSDSFADLQKRAKRGGRDVFFTHFAQEPEKRRGELVELKLHLVRTLKFEAGKNSAGVKEVYEAWGVTDNDSRSNPYVVVFSEKPPELPLGADINEEATFVGYFLKDMQYEAFDVRRWAPLLIGRLRWRENEARTQLAAQKADNWYVWPVLGVGSVVLIGLVGSWAWRLKHPKRRAQLGSPIEEQKAIEGWIEQAEAGQGPDESLDLQPPPGHRAVSGALDWTDPNRHNESP